MPIIEFRCKHCKRRFSLRVKAVECENSHLFPQKVTSAEYVLGSYPMVIEAEFSDGKAIRYILEDEYFRK